MANMRIKQHLSMILLSCMLNLANTSKALRYFSNFQFEKRTIYGEEQLIKDYVTLANDPTANLPDTFTLAPQFISSSGLVSRMLESLKY